MSIRVGTVVNIMKAWGNYQTRLDYYRKKVAEARAEGNIKNINYNGTVKEWQAIKKYVHWRMDSSDFIIYCTDGQIFKDGTVTYY